MVEVHPTLRPELIEQRADTWRRSRKASAHLIRLFVLLFNKI
jgi:hypothetical protein